MPKKSKRSRRATGLLALLSSRSIAPVDGGVDDEEAAVIKGSTIPASGIDGATKTRGGSASVPTFAALRNNQQLRASVRRHLESKLDVGVLSSTTTSHRRAQSNEQLMSECTARCPSSKLCSCLYLDEYDPANECSQISAIPEIAEACRNDEHWTCLRGDNATIMDVLYCPTYECVDEFEGIDEILTADVASQTNDTLLYIYGVIGTCAYCVGYKSLCEFCTDNEEFMSDSANCLETNEVCANATREGTYPYSQECVDFVEGDVPTATTEAAATTTDVTATAAEEMSPTLSCPDTLDHSTEVDSGAVLNYAIVPSDPADANNGILCARLEVEGESWVGFGISEKGQMVGSDAIVALPDEGVVQKYMLFGKSANLVVTRKEESQTLMDTSVVQEDGKTVMEFTKLLIEDGEIPILEEGENNFLFAKGSGNELGYHSNRVAFTKDFSEDVAEIVTSTEASTTEATTTPEATTTAADTVSNYWLI